jgi:hypothetical protein
MKKHLAGTILVALALAVLAPPAIGWEKGTHLYIADLLKKHGFMNPGNQDEMYGAMAPDIFNYVFDLPPGINAYLYDQTHHNFMALWKSVRWGYEKELALGFVSHNDSWGADFTAHHQGRTFGLTEGYIIAKAQLLSGAIDWSTLEAVLGGALPDQVKLDLCHNIVEAAGDVILKRYYPGLGLKLIAAGSRLGDRFRNLLLKAYLPGLSPLVGGDAAARTIILGSEAAFRQQQVVMYGLLMRQDETTILQGLAVQFNMLVGGYLASLGINLPDGTDLTPIILYALNGAILLCENDYMTEVNATVQFVERQLKAHKVWGSTRH